MNAHVPLPSNVVRLPARLRMVPAAPSALDALLSAGAIDARQHGTGLAYAALRRRFEAATRSFRARPGGACLPEAAWFALKRRHAALTRAAGADRFLLDRLCLDGEAPLRSEVERVRAALDRMTHLITPSANSPC